MGKYQLSKLFIYPVKSLGGISVHTAEVTDRGFQYDRRWMLVDETNKFLSQRKVKEMSLLQTKLREDSLIVFNKLNPEQIIEIPLKPEINNFEQSIVWDDIVNVGVYENEVNKWFSEQLKMSCKLVYMPDQTKRNVEQHYAQKNEITSLSDGYPFLLIGQESLDLLNSKLETPLPMNRFRPNLVFTGGKPHAEDNWKQFKINDIIFKPVKPCARCVITTINQQTGEQSPEPLKTLSTYRSIGNKVMFGMNLLHEGKGAVSVGDEIVIIQ